MNFNFFSILSFLFVVSTNASAAPFSKLGGGINDIELSDSIASEIASVSSDVDNAESNLLDIIDYYEYLYDLSLANTASLENVSTSTSTSTWTTLKSGYTFSYGSTVTIPSSAKYISVNGNVAAIGVTKGCLMSVGTIGFTDAVYSESIIANGCIFLSEYTLSFRPVSAAYSSEYTSLREVGGDSRYYSVNLEYME